jgi:hypothetical protein
MKLSSVSKISILFMAELKQKLANLKNEIEHKFILMKKRTSLVDIPVGGPMS